MRYLYLCDKGYPSSIDFFSSLDLNFICCSPDYLPTAKVGLSINVTLTALLDDGDSFSLLSPLRSLLRSLISSSRNVSSAFFCFLMDKILWATCWSYFFRTGEASQRARLDWLSCGMVISLIFDPQSMVYFRTSNFFWCINMLLLYDNVLLCLIWTAGHLIQGLGFWSLKYAPDIFFSLLQQECTTVYYDMFWCSSRVDNSIRAVKKPFNMFSQQWSSVFKYSKQDLYFYMFNRVVMQPHAP